MENLKICTLIAAMLTSMALSACTPPMERAYTLDGPRNAMFGSDLQSCKQHARAYQPNARRDGALIGAASGAVFGAIDNEDDAAEGALIGAGIGALAGISAAQDELNEEQRNVVIRCLQNRGHKVIG